MSSPRLPPEILDYILDTLHDEPDTLHSCSLVAKSWVPHARRLLFVSVDISPGNLGRWKETFPDPSNSPACYTRTLHVLCSTDITMADAAEGGWISSFSRVLELELDLLREGSLGTLEMFLIPFHGFSPILKSLYIDSPILPCSQFFKFACSFPLEDLTINCQSLNDSDNPDAPQVIVPPTSPALTGSLRLRPRRGLATIARRLLDLPNGLRFRRLNLEWRHEEDIQWVKRLVVACRDTLEVLNITRLTRGASDPCSVVPRLIFVITDGSALAPSTIDLSRAPKLQAITFSPETFTAEWIVAALETIAPKHRDLRRITIFLNDSAIASASPNRRVLESIGERVHKQWLDLDRLLLRLWESQSIRTEAVGTSLRDVRDAKAVFRCLLPEMTERGVIEVSSYGSILHEFQRLL